MKRVVKITGAALVLGGAALLSVFLAAGGAPEKGAIAANAPAPEAPVGEVVPQGVAITPVWICYEFFNGDDEMATVRLSTKNFGSDLVRVRRMIRMCEESLKFPDDPAIPAPNPPTDPTILACHRLEKGNSPNDPYLLNTQNFGEDVVVVARSRLMCESATKRHIGSTLTIGHTGAPIWQCYDVEGGHVVNEGHRYTNLNFRDSRAFVMQLVMLCEEAHKEKLDAAGNIVSVGEATGAVVACYTIESPQDPQAQVVLRTDNFGPDRVQIRRAVLLCERTPKIPIFDIDIDPTLPHD
jgi:hypothetical protein